MVAFILRVALAILLPGRWWRLYVAVLGVLRLWRLTSHLSLNHNLAGPVAVCRSDQRSPARREASEECLRPASSRRTPTSSEGLSPTITHIFLARVIAV